MNEERELLEKYAFYRQGVKDERERIIAYLMEQDILRDAMFYPGFVAMNTSGTTGIDLPLELGGD